MRPAEILTYAAMAAGVVGVVAQCLEMSHGWVGVLAAAVVLFFTRLGERMRADDVRTRRLVGILMFSAASLGASAYLMMEGKRYWLVPLMISATLELYASLRAK